MSTLPAPFTVRLTPKGAKRLRAGLPWVYRVDVAAPPEGAAPGQVVRVVDGQGNFVGQAFWAAKSPIAVRLLSRSPAPIDAGFFRERIRAALELRKSLFPTSEAFRVVHGEADLLPGLFVDRYGDSVTVQIISEGMDARQQEIAGIVDELLAPRLIALRNDTAARDFELLPRRSELLKGTGPARARYHEGPNLFELDLMEDLKTGAFLDQQENHLRAAEYAQGRGLDCFTYHGGFALALARRCHSVLAVDQLEENVESVRANVKRNALNNVETRAANAFDLLRELEKEKRRFEIVVLDPPAFAKRKEGIPAAERAYKELNLRALKLLEPGGVLVTCSCSGKMTPELFGGVIQSAIEDVRRPVQILEKRAAGRDHPALAGLPETDYLKCWILRVL